ACKMNLGRTTVQIHRMQQPIRTPRAPAVARLVASAHRKNCEEARSSGGPPRRIPPNFPEVRSPSESIRTLNRNSFLEPASSCLSSPVWSLPSSWKRPKRSLKVRIPCPSRFSYSDCLCRICFYSVCSISIAQFPP
uniref:Uncharacterized protein n=1 Tax=Aegilops tauschii subsp. strangulata TaxID=200361 RepID=A0A453JVT0_AEGTS